MTQNKFKIDTVQIGSVLQCMSPDAFARIKGDYTHEMLQGYVLFYEIQGMVLVVADIHGLPEKTGKCHGGIHAMHIHSGSSCTGNAEDSFADAKSHYSINDCPHPWHSGDMPPLFSDNGNAWSAFVTSKFTVPDIIGKTVIVHEGIDDFTSQPAGNSGKKIGCGVIYKNG
ncbi:MAG: superoxide dismutase family protein [Bacteroides sp.]